MSDLIQADYPQLDSIANKFSTLASDNQQLEQLLRQKTDSLQGNWEGVGAISFFSEMQDTIFPTLQRLNSALEEGSLTTQKISEIMQGAETEAANAFAVGGGSLATLAAVSATAGGMAAGAAAGSSASSLNQLKATAAQIKETVAQIKDFVKNGVTLSGSVSASDSMYSTGFDGWYGKGSLDLMSYSAQANGKVTLGKDGLNAKGSVSAEAYLINASYRGDFGPLDIKADAYVGAKGSASGELKFDPLAGEFSLSAQGEAFAGAKATAEGKLDLGDFGSVEGKAEAWAGIGIKGNADIGYEDGKFSFEFGGGAALGVGAAFNVKFDIDIGKGIDKVKDVVSDVGDSIESVGKGIKKVWDSIF